MSDAQQEINPIFNLQRIYLKDLSLELPNAPQVFLVGESPVVDVAMNIGAQNLDENVYEVEVVATVTTKVNEDILYLVEVKQAGIFNIANMPEDQLDPILGIMCPNIIYPYLRANIADIISRASLPPLHLAEINFQAFYEQRLAQQAQAEDSDIVVPTDAKLN